MRKIREFRKVENFCNPSSVDSINCYYSSKIQNKRKRQVVNMCGKVIITYIQYIFFINKMHLGFARAYLRVHTRYMAQDREERKRKGEGKKKKEREKPLSFHIRMRDEIGAHFVWKNQTMGSDVRRPSAAIFSLCASIVTDNRERKRDLMQFSRVARYDVRCTPCEKTSGEEKRAAALRKKKKRRGGRGRGEERERGGRDGGSSCISGSRRGYIDQERVHDIGEYIIHRL